MVEMPNRAKAALVADELIKDSLVDFSKDNANTSFIIAIMQRNFHGLKIGFDDLDINRTLKYWHPIDFRAFKQFGNCCLTYVSNLFLTRKLRWKTFYELIILNDCFFFDFGFETIVFTFELFLFLVWVHYYSSDFN